MRLLLSVIVSLLVTLAYAQNQEQRLKIRNLTGDFYLFETYNLYQGHRIGANGMYVVTDAGVVMIDSPWDTSQYQPLLDSIARRHQKPVIVCLATHFHEDRTGGLEYYSKKGIRTYTTRKTDVLSAKRGMKRAEFLIEKDTVFTTGQYQFEVFYPGEGHTPDNIVVWFEKERILYGGCLIKSTEDDTLGNLGDANVSAYANTVRNVIAKCRKPKWVIPGHNAPDVRALKHTWNMAKEFSQSQSSSQSQSENENQ